jgi:hypothetical protein
MFPPGSTVAQGTPSIIPTPHVSTPRIGDAGALGSGRPGASVRRHRAAPRGRTEQERRSARRVHDVGCGRCRVAAPLRTSEPGRHRLWGTRWNVGLYGRAVDQPARAADQADSRGSGLWEARLRATASPPRGTCAPLAASGHRALTGGRVSFLPGWASSFSLCAAAGPSIHSRRCRSVRAASKRKTWSRASPACWDTVDMTTRIATVSQGMRL